MVESVLQVSEVDTSYRDFGIHDIDFNLLSGEIMGLIGKSGSGKSTLIKTILGLKKPDNGSVDIVIDGAPKNIKQVTGYSSQENSLYGSLTIKENLETFGSLRGISKKEVMESSEDFLRELGIYEARNKRVDQLSGGMKKRADIAVATVHDPKLVVFDEPFSGIDPPQRKIIWKSIHSMTEEGKMVILTSHLIDDLTQNCNHFGLISQGDFYYSDEIKSMMNETDYASVNNFINDVFRL